MVTFDDLTDEQVLVLTEPEIQKYIDLQCAIDGVSLLPERPVKPEYTMPKKDVTMYRVGSHLVGTMEDAQKVSTLLKSVTVYETNYCSGDGYEKYVKPCNLNAEIETDTYYSEDRYAEIKNELITYEKTKKEYAEAKNEYDTMYKNREAISEEIYGRINNIHAEEDHKLKLINKFKEYIKLADGNKEIAFSFLSKVEEVSDYKDMLMEVE